MSQTTIVDIPPVEQARMKAELRRARYGYLVAWPILLRRAGGRTPTEIAACVFCSRSRVYRVVQASQAGKLVWEVTEEGALTPPDRTTPLAPALPRALVALLTAMPRVCGWCRPRGSCATGALALRVRRGLPVSAEPVRRWLHAGGWEGKRAKVVAKDAAPDRVAKLARSRWAFEHMRAGMALFFADELDSALLPKVGAQWLPKAEQVELPPPGTNETRYLAGALDIRTGAMPHCGWYRKVTGLFLDVRDTRERLYPAAEFPTRYAVVDTAKIHQARAVAEWLAAHPRVALLSLPTSCPRANPLERACGDGHDKCTRNHRRNRMGDLVGDVNQQVATQGPWRSRLSERYYTPEVTAAVQALAAQEQLPLAA